MAYHDIVTLEVEGFLRFVNRSSSGSGGRITPTSQGLARVAAADGTLPGTSSAFVLVTPDDRATAMNLRFRASMRLWRVLRDTVTAAELKSLLSEIVDVLSAIRELLEQQAPSSDQRSANVRKSRRLVSFAAGAMAALASSTSTLADAPEAAETVSAAAQRINELDGLLQSPSVPDCGPRTADSYIYRNKSPRPTSTGTMAVAVRRRGMSAPRRGATCDRTCAGDPPFHGFRDPDGLRGPERVAGPASLGALSA